MATKCPPEEIKIDLELNEDAQKKENRARIEQKIKLPFTLRVIEKLSKIGKWQPTPQKLTQEEWDNLFGPKDQRIQKAIEISEIMTENPQIADYMLEYIQNDIARESIKIKDAFTFDKVTGKTMPVLENFPIAKLNLYRSELSAWSKATGANFDTFKFQHYDISLKPTIEIRRSENSGSYARIHSATERHAEAIAYKIAKYWKPVDDIYLQASELWNEMGDYKDVWKDQFNLTDVEAKEWFHSTINRMAEGQIVYKNQKDVNKSKEFTEGAGLYIYTQNAPTKNTYESTGDAVFRWQKPVKFDGYDPKIHGEAGINNDGKSKMKLIDHLGRERNDLLEYIQMSIPIDAEMLAKLNKLVKDFRAVDDEVAKLIVSDTARTFNDLTKTLKKFFPKLNANQVKSLFLNEDLSVLDGLDADTKRKYREDYNYLESNFTKYSLSEPFMREAVVADYKKDHFPAMYHTGEYPILLKEAIATSEATLETYEGSLQELAPADKLEMKGKIAGLKKSLFNMKKSLAQALDLPFDMEDNMGMVTRRESKYSKHISNAFDKLKMRTDSNVYKDYLKHVFTTSQNNVLTKELLESFLMSDYKSVREANISLYKTTLGMPDARGNILGYKRTNEDYSDTSRMIMRSMRDYWMTKIAGPGTAIINQFGNVEKVHEIGIDKTMELFADIGRYNRSAEIKPKYEQFVLDAGITQFEDFFTHSLVQDLEQVEMKRDDAIQISHAIIQYYDYRNKIGKKAAKTKLEKRLTELFGRTLVPGGLLTKEEAKGLKGKERQRKIKSMTSKFVNFAISKQYNMRRSLRNAPPDIKNLLGLKKVTFQGFERIADYIRENLKSFVMSETEKSLRESSMIAGIKGAQSKGLIRDKDGNVVTIPFYDMAKDSVERNEAIKYGRMMTRTVMDFGMSKNDVGEMHRTVLGQLLGQFAVWKQQKQNKDINLYKKAWKSVRDSRDFSPALKEFFSQLARYRKYSQEDLRTLNPDMANLRSFIATQGVLTLAMDLFFGYTALFNNPIARTFAFNIGMSKTSGLTSDVQAWINLPFILLARMFFGMWWEDEEELEQTIGYYARRTPMGLAFGTGVDLASMLVFWSNENIRNKKMQRLGGSAIPLP